MTRLHRIADRVHRFGSGRYGKLRLAAVSAAVLSIGASLTPRAPAPVVRPTDEAAAPLLRSELRRRDVVQLFQEVQDVGRTAASFVAVFPAQDRVPVELVNDFAPPERTMRPPEGYGLIASAAGEILTHVRALAGQLDPEVQLPFEVITRGRVTAYEPATGLALVLVEGGLSLSAPDLATVTPEPGELVAAVARDDGREFSVPAYVASIGTDEVFLSAAGGTLEPGMPIFTLSGDALAVATVVDRRAFPVAATLERLRRLAGSGRGLPRTLGLAFQQLTPALSSALGEGSVVVSAVEQDGPGAGAGVRPGDVVLKVAGADVSSVREALAQIAALPLDGPSDLVVRRDGQEQAVTVQARPTLAFAEALPRVAPVEDAPAAGAVFPPEALAAAGVPADARLLELARRRVTERGARTILRRSPGPWLVYVEYQGRRFFSVVEGAS